MTKYIKIIFSILKIKFSIKISKNIFYKIINKTCKIKNNRILFSNFHGMGYGCNPKYIANEIIRQNLPYEMYWVADYERTTDFTSVPKEIKLVKKYSLYFWYILMTSKIWIINTTLQAFYNIDKRPEQILIQTGHGSLGIKKIGTDDTTSTPDKLEVISKESKELDMFFSNSKFETEVYSRGFKYAKDKIIETGHARNDIFFQNTDICRKKIRKFYNINLHNKILLYVPTFRKDGRYDCYNISYNLLLKELKNKFDGNWKILVRFHPKTIPFIEKFFTPSDNLINATYYEDIQELLAGSDIAITDYSSCIFDFVLSKQPAFIYATDYEKFDDDQGCYYPLTSTPFPVASDNENLINNIINFDEIKYNNKVNEFIQSKGCIEDGHASERIVKHIKNLIIER